MTKTVTICDRCKKEDDHRNDDREVIEIHTPGTADNVEHVDLCGECQRECVKAWQRFMNPPQIAP